MCFAAPEQKSFYGNFLFPDSAERVYNQGLNFAKFYYPLVLFTICFVAPEEKLFYGNFCYLTLSSVYWKQGLNFTKCFTPWSFLHCVLWLQKRSCFTAIFVTWPCRACIGTRGVISLNVSRPGLVYTVFCGSRREVVLRQFLLPHSVERALEPGLNFAKIVTPWSCLHCVLWLQSRSCFAANFWLLTPSSMY